VSHPLHGDCHLFIGILIFFVDMAQASAAANRILSLRGRYKAGGKVLPLDLSDIEGGVQIELQDL
jgi:hypothetical protein